MGLTSKIVEFLNLSPRQKKKPILKEVSRSDDSQNIGLRGLTYNPDDLITRKGLQIYDEMMKDAQVKASVSAKLYARLASGWEIQSASQNSNDIEIKNFVNYSIEHMEGPFEDDLYEISEAIIKGYSITEINWQYIKSGSWKGKIGLLSLKAKDPANFGFKLDKYLNIEQVVNSVAFKEESLPVEKFIVFSYNKKHERPWGQSDLRAAYRDWWTKDYCYKQRNISAQRLAQPIIIGKYDENTIEDEQRKLEQIIKNVQNETAIVLPKGIDIDIKSIKDTGSEEFQRLVDNCNMEITKAILGVTLVIEESKRYGSYATAKVHYDMLMFHLQRLGYQLESVINDQLIKRLVDYNFNIESYPKFRFKPYRGSDVEQIGNLILALVDKNIVDKNETWIREKLNIPTKGE